MDLKAIRARWSAKAASSKAAKLTVRTAELAAVLDAGCPDGFAKLRATLSGPVTLLPPAHLKQIADHEPRTKDKPAVVSRRRKPTVDAAPDPGAV
jgi:hypothetical protein